MQIELKPKNKLEAVLATAVGTWFLAVVACTAPVSSPATSEAVEQAVKAFLEHPLLVFNHELKDLEHKKLPSTRVEAVRKESSYKTKDFNCAVEALVHEIMVGNQQAMQNVMDVIYNRAQHDKFPDGVCGVVKQYRQFSYRNSWNKNKNWSYTYENLTELEQNKLDTIKQIADNTLRFGSKNQHVLWYHTVELKKPSWTKNLKVAKQDKWHIFYKED